MERLGLAEFSPKTRGRWQTSAELHTENMLISCPSHELHPTYATTKTTAVVNSPLAPAHLVDARSAVTAHVDPRVGSAVLETSHFIYHDGTDANRTTQPGTQTATQNTG